MTDLRRRRRKGLVVGVIGTLLVVVALFPWSTVPSAMPALLLLIPISVASAIADWKVGVPLAAVAGLTYALAFLPPIGHVRIGFTDDVFVVVTFVLVAVMVSVLAGRQRVHEQTQIDEQRVGLLRSVSHDLRTPLGTIRAASSDLLSRETVDVETRAALLGLVIDEAERLDRIVGNLLSVTSLAQGSIAPVPEAVAPAVMVDEAVARLRRGTTVPIVVDDVDDDLPAVLADEVLIDQVLANLVENAVRFAPAGTPVRISARPEGRFVAFTVSDQGPGFTSAAAAPARDGASGVGLGLCRAVIDAHRGELRIGHPDGAGAEVTFTLPVARRAVRPRARGRDSETAPTGS